LILVVSVAVVAVVSVLLGRWLQRKGAAMERRRDEPPR
jgi:membrane-anchored protein YejM (alkaline phosphatase superfamily)